jgi:hypothetical protein
MPEPPFIEYNLTFGPSSTLTLRSSAASIVSLFCGRAHNLIPGRRTRISGWRRERGGMSQFDGGGNR